MTYLKQIMILVHKDILSELRSKEMVSSMLVFSILTAVIFSFAFESDSDTIRKVFPGILWIALIFAGILGLNRSISVELMNDALMGLMLGVADPGVIYLSKSLSNFLFLLLIQVVNLPILFIIFNMPVISSYLFFILIVFLGTWGFIALGTFMSVLSANTNFSEVLLPIILFPLIIPLLIAAVQATGSLFSETGFQGLSTWLAILMAFDVIFTVIPWILFDYLLEV